MESKLILPKLAFNVLIEAGNTYKSCGKFPNETLEVLHSLFGAPFMEAAELIDAYKFQVIQYETKDQSRSVFKVSSQKEQFTIYKDINFCCCSFFKNEVLTLRRYLTCKHVLAVKLSRIMEKVNKECVDNERFVEFLNEQINYLNDY